jgi:hypothetical protein
MRFWLSNEERRPDPVPVVTEDRAAVRAGRGLWVIALAALRVFVGPLVEAGRVWWLWTCLVGIGLGLVALVYVHRRARQR